MSWVLKYLWKFLKGFGYLGFWNDVEILIVGLYWGWWIGIDLEVIIDGWVFLVFWFVIVGVGWSCVG